MTGRRQPAAREAVAMSETVSPEMRAQLTLQLVPGIGPRLTAALLAQFGSAEAVLRARPDELRSVPHIGPKLADQVATALERVDVEAELERLRQHDARLLVLGTPNYPAALATIADPPQLLYLRGSVTGADANAVAVVGSRSCTSYGRRVAERLAAGLARAGWTVVSGLARGIDGAAHRGALRAGGRTLAVLAGGLARVYPPEHADLAREVVAAGGLLSESSMAQEPLAPLFPARNRLISGLCRGVVIVEAAEQSGALITASHAADQGRAVFAVPGPVDSPASGGTHALIRKGAILVRSADDILEELSGTAPLTEPAAPAASCPPGLDDLQQRIWEMLTEPRHLDDLAEHLGVGVASLSGTLMLLEMKKVVRRLPGNRYERSG
jgi:DNA processing protein